MNAKERVVIERRTHEAIRKNYMGAAGKLGVIAQILGHPIQRQGSPLFDIQYLDDPYDIPDPDVIPTFSEGDDYVITEGFLFDGTTSGIHMEIKYLIAENRIKLSWQGYLVYEEKAGDLFAYVPNPEWEKWIEKLYAKAKEKGKKQAAVQQEIIEERTKTQLGRFMDRMRKRWGI